MTDGCTVVDDTADLFGEEVSFCDCLTVGGGPAVHERLLCFQKGLCSEVDCLVVGDVFVGSVCLAHTREDNTTWVSDVEVLFCTDCTGVSDLFDSLSVVSDVDFKVIAKGTAEGTNYVFDGFSHSVDLLHSSDRTFRT